MAAQWWKKAVVYQVYPRSFQDSNGDGTGDLNGITMRLPYLQELGINVLWISPVYRSPMEDNGYDIADYYSVDPLFGTDQDMDRLIEEARKRGIRIIMDLVINHCSDEHVWFQKAVEDENCEDAGYFYFKRTPDKKEPCNWRSNFGGSVWSRLPDGRWYYHTFSRKQPDLNWENPALRRKLYNMINWWLEKGIAGFRVDAITFIKKDTGFASRQTADGGRYPVENFENYPGIDSFLSELKRETFDRFDCLTVAEAPGVGKEDFRKYAGANGYFSMIFDFSWESMEGEKDKSSLEAVERLKKKLFDSQRFISENGWCGVFLENHDQSRCMNRYLEEKDRNGYSERALAILYFFLCGTPYLYQGQEIGMRNAVWNSMDEMNDVRAKTTFKERVALGEPPEQVLAYFNDWGRDNARTPMQWDDSENAGFTDGAPWLKVQENYRQVNVKNQEKDPNSLLSFYKTLIRLHGEEPYQTILSEGDFCPVLQDVPGLIAYERSARAGKLLVLVNLYSEECRIDRWRFGIENGLWTGGVRINNYRSVEATQEALVLKPYQALALSVNNNKKH